jgi:hypothetical protein
MEICMTTSIGALSNASWQASTTDGTDDVSIEAQLGSIFDQMDPNGTGSITDAEFLQAADSNGLPQPLQNQVPADLLAALDPNGTGRVSKADFVAGLARLAGDPASAPAATAHHRHRGAKHGAEPDDAQASAWDLISQTLATAPDRTAPPDSGSGRRRPAG